MDNFFLHNCSAIKADGVLKSVQNELQCAVLGVLLTPLFSHFSFPMENDSYKKPLNPINAKNGSYIYTKTFNFIDRV